VLLSITPPTTNDRGPQYMEKVFSSVLESIDYRDEIHLEYGCLDGTIGIYCRFASHLKAHITEHLKAKYPNCTIEEIDEHALDDGDALRTTWSASLVLCPDLFPILRHKQFQDLIDGSLEDPLESLLGVIQPEPDLIPRIQITVRPTRRRRRRWGRGAVKKLDRSFFRSHFRLADFYAQHITSPFTWPLAFPLGMVATSDRSNSLQADTSGGRYGEREDDVQAAADKIGGNLFDARICLSVSASNASASAAIIKLRTMRGAFGAFTKSRLATFQMSPIRRGRPRPGSRFFLSHEELATLFHPATQTVHSERMAVTPFAELEAPANLASVEGSRAVVLGAVQHKDDRRPFAIAAGDRRRHCYVVGKTGMGKTTLLENMIRSDIGAGYGVAVIDPHGDLFETILQGIPTKRTNDAIVFDPADPEYAVSFNPLSCSDPEKRDQVASGVVSAFKKLYDSWGPRLEDTLRNAVYLAIEHGGTFHTVMRLLSDEPYRLRLTARIEDPIARQFWEYEFERWNDRYRTEAIAAIQNKLRPFLMSRRIRAIIAQGGRSIDLRQLMDDGNVLLVNLSKGRIGEDNSNLLGALLVTALQQAAMSRADVEEDSRRDFYIYIDEFQNFSTGSFATILSEARKYRLNMTLSHQYLEQLDEKIADAVFGNVGSIISFQVGSTDAHSLSLQLSKYEGQVRPEDLANLPKYTAYIRLLHEGMPLPPFSMTTFPPRATEEKRGVVVRQVSNDRHAKLRDAVLSRLDQDSSRQRNSVFAPQAPGSEIRVSDSISVV